MAPLKLTRSNQCLQVQKDAQYDQRNPPLDHTDIEAMVEQQIVDALAALKTNRHTNSGIRAGGESSQGNNQGAPRACMQKDFINCKPKTFDGNEGVVGITRWIEKTKSIFEISYCAEGCRVKFVAYTFGDKAMYWWNSHVKAMGLANDNALSWQQLKQMLIEFSFRGNAVIGVRVVEPDDR